MIRLNLHEVKVQLSKYIEMVEGGETIIVCKRNVPVAEIRQIADAKMRTPVLGSAVGKGKIPISFFEALPEAELRLWEGEDKNDPLKKYAPRAAKARKPTR